MKIYLLSLYLISTLFFFGCGKKDDDTVKKVLKPVKYASVVQVGGEIIKSFNGTSQSGSETNLSFRTNGLIVKLNVKVGDKVKKKQLLAQLDLNDLQLNYQKATAAVQSSKSQLETAKSAFERTKEMYLANSASLNDYEQVKNNYSGAQSSYKTARKSLQLQALQLQYAKITAPTDGFVSAVNSEVNEFVTAGFPIIVINSDEEDIEVKIGVTENYISKIADGDEAEISFTGIPGKKFKGIVSEVGYASAQQATSPVVLRVAEIVPEMRPGMPVEVTFTFGNKKEKSTLSVPVSAVGQDNEGTFVYILTKEKDHNYKAVKTVVQTGKLSNDGYEVISGLKEGDLVATAGLRSLYDGMEVRLLQ